MATTPWGDPSAPDIVQAAAIVLAVLSPVTVGAILMFRLPRNAIGRVLLVSGLMLALNIGTTGLAQYGLVSHPGSVPGAIWVAVFSEVTWVPFMVGLALYLPLLFPSGRLPSPRWRPVAVLGLVAIGISTLQNAFSPFAPGTFPPEVVNPLAVGGPVADLLSLLGAVLTILGLSLLPMAAASIVLRYRGAAGIERQQLKWLAAVGALVGVALVVGLVTGSDTTGIGGTVAKIAWLVVILGFGLMPVTIGLAILRYRLYELDRLVSRTITYGILTIVVGSLFLAFVFGFQAVLVSITQSNSLAVAGSTLLVFSMFQPLRRRIQRSVDRRFNRSGYDADRTVAALAGRLRDEVDPAQLAALITGMVSQSVEPASVSLWLRRS